MNQIALHASRARLAASDVANAVTMPQIAFGKVPDRRLKIGVIAAELPPGHGGMQEHALGLVSFLSADHDIVVFTSRETVAAFADPGVRVQPVLTWRVTPDIRTLEGAGMDAWITLNAGLAAYATELSAPVFAYVHGNDFTRPWLPHPGRAIRLTARLFGPDVVRHWRQRQIAAGLRASRKVFANSDFSRRLCARVCRTPVSKIEVVPPGMRPDFFRAGDPSPHSCLRLVSVSRLAALAQRKNIDGVIEAVALLKNEIEISYTIIGEGDDLARLQALADQLGVSRQVHFLGGVATERVIEEFCRSDAFVMAVKSSGIDVEGFGMVFAEAAATGLPSIGARIGGIPEVIEEGVSGVLLDDVSAAGIGDGLRRFHSRRQNFDRDLIRAKARQFSAPVCSAMIARVIAEMV